MIEIEEDEVLNEKVYEQEVDVEELVVDKRKGKVVEDSKEDKVQEGSTKKGENFAKKETLFVPPPYEPKLPFRAVLRSNNWRSIKQCLMSK